MPHLRFRGITLEAVKQVSRELLAQLEAAFQCPKDWITLEHNPITFVVDGEEHPGATIVEVLWFDRGQETKKTVAQSLTRLLQPHAQGGEVAVIFYPLQRDNYFDNGEDYAT